MVKLGLKKELILMLKLMTKKITEQEKLELKKELIQMQKLKI